MDARFHAAVSLDSGCLVAQLTSSAAKHEAKSCCSSAMRNACKYHEICRLLERKDTLPSDCIGRALLDLQEPSPDGKQGMGMKQLVSNVAIFIAAGVNLVLWQWRHIKKPVACQERACLLQNAHSGCQQLHLLASRLVVVTSAAAAL